MRNLYFRQKVIKLTDHFFVYDDYKKPVYKVDQDLTLIGHKVKVVNLETKDCFIIEKKLVSLLPIYTVRFDDGRMFNIKQHFTFFKLKVDFESDDFDLEILGDVLGLNYYVDDFDGTVAYISKELFSIGDVFKLEIGDKRYQDAVLAISIVVDRILDDR